MRIAFVGIKRPFRPIPDEIGIDLCTFVQYHLELPWYYAKYGGHHCYITTVDEAAGRDIFETTAVGDGGWLTITREDWLYMNMDVVVHWRSWQEWAHERCPSAIHVMQTCDHTYGEEWLSTVRRALDEEKLQKIIAFETWHVRQLQSELMVDYDKFITQVHLGVDTETYRPAEKDPYKLLWASDPGRGFRGCLDVFQELYRIDRRYTLHVTYPDYVKDVPTVTHPNVKFHRRLRNGPALWDLFNTAGVIPYTSVFPEPSSRVHRQGQAAGCVVAYPENMGSPSELIIDGRTGLIIQAGSAPYDWAMRIHETKDRHRSIGEQARNFALTEDWEVQAVRFNRVMRELKSR